EIENGRMNISKSTIVGFAAGVVAVCTIGGIIILSRATIDHEAQAAANKAAMEAAHTSATQAANQGGRKAAQDIWDKLLAGMDKSLVPPPPAVEVTKVETETKVDREAFTITVPPGSTVDPQIKYPGAEHVLSVNVAGHCLISIIVVDSKD